MVDGPIKNVIAGGLAYHEPDSDAILELSFESNPSLQNRLIKWGLPLLYKGLLHSFGIKVLCVLNHLYFDIFKKICIAGFWKIESEIQWDAIFWTLMVFKFLDKI
jgi:hypothetical protein